MVTLATLPKVLKMSTCYDSRKVKFSNLPTILTFALILLSPTKNYRLSDLSNRLSDSSWLNVTSLIPGRYHVLVIQAVSVPNDLSASLYSYYFGQNLGENVGMGKRWETHTPG